MGMTSWERAVMALVVIAAVAVIVLAVGDSRERLRRLALMTAAATFVLIVLGAYVRLADAGLGCPDWPGCYGQFTPTLATDAIKAAEMQAPQGPVSMQKAWKEMIHRYLAMVVGCLIMAIAVGATRQRGTHPSNPALAWTLVAAVIFQAVLGAWTVTWLLKPAIVTLHLLGGMAILALLAWYALRIGPVRSKNTRAAVLRAPSRLALAALVIQIALGGWVSANYAAAVCGKLPLCQDALLPPMDFDHGFHLVRELGKTAQGANLPLPALTAIHMTHRVFALVVFATFIWLIWRAWHIAGCRRLAMGVALALLVQVALGLKVVWSMSNAHLELATQLPAAAAHNATAAALLVLTLLINFRSSTARRFG